MRPQSFSPTRSRWESLTREQKPETVVRFHHAALCRYRKETAKPRSKSGNVGREVRAVSTVALCQAVVYLASVAELEDAMTLHGCARLEGDKGAGSSPVQGHYGRAYDLPETKL